MSENIIDKNNHLEIRGAFLVAFSGLLYGFMAYFGTQLININLTVTTMLFWRFFLAMVWVLLSATWQKKKIFKNLPSYSVLLKIILLGGASYSGGSLFFFLASEYTGTGVAMVIFFCFPVFVTLFAWVTSSWRMNIHGASSLIAIVIGLLLLKGHGTHALSLPGITFAIIAGISYAFYVIYSKKNTTHLDSNLLTFLVCLGNSLIFFIISCVTKSFYVPTTLHAWIYISAIGIVATAIPIQLLLDGIKHVSSIKASILSVLEPVVTLLVGISLLKESMSGIQAAGIMVILLGAILIQFEKKEHSLNLTIQ